MQELLLYTNNENKEVFDIMKKVAYGELKADGEDSILIAKCISHILEVSEKMGFKGNLWQDYIAYEISVNENAFSLSCERKGRMEKNGYWLGQIIGSRFYGYEMQTLEEYSAAVNALTIEDIKAVAAKYLKHDGYVRVSMKPESMKPAK